ncbi:MAG: NIPSNAP family containing protein [Terrimonas sp.]|nr:NIPSNAP family containing protein [Terrimonas sp.]
MQQFWIAFISIMTLWPAAGKATPVKEQHEFYRISVYHFVNSSQEQVLDQYFEKAFLPFLHKNKFDRVGVFKPLANDTAADKKIYLFLQATTLEKLVSIDGLLAADGVYQEAAKDFAKASFDNAPFTRIETILLRSFRLTPKMALPVLSTPKSDHIYELRSYESPTESLYTSKVKMFNEGGEIAIFKRLKFNAVFYADVLSGSHMPNLMYMTSFDDLEARNSHWKSFSSDSDWKNLSSLPEYQHNVSHADVILMRAADYSDF